MRRSTGRKSAGSGVAAARALGPMGAAAFVAGEDEGDKAVLQSCVERFHSSLHNICTAGSHITIDGVVYKGGGDSSGVDEDSDHDAMWPSFPVWSYQKTSLANRYLRAETKFLEKQPPWFTLSDEAQNAAIERLDFEQVLTELGLTGWTDLEVAFKATKPGPYTEISPWQNDGKWQLDTCQHTGPETCRPSRGGVRHPSLLFECFSYEKAVAVVLALRISLALSPTRSKALVKALKQSGVLASALRPIGMTKAEEEDNFDYRDFKYGIATLWLSLLEVASQRMQQIGAALNNFFESAIDGNLACLKCIPHSPKPLRADEHGLIFPPFELHDDKTSYAKASARFVVAAAELCTDEFQRRVAAIVGGLAVDTPIEHQVAPPKGYARIMNKHGLHTGHSEYEGKGGYAQGSIDFVDWKGEEDEFADHGREKHPRVACNVDTVRCGLVCAPRQVKKLHSALGAVGTRLRTKNDFLISPEEAAAKFHYRCILDNYEVSFAPTDTFAGVTHADVAERIPEFKPFFDSHPKLAATPLTLICETQIILPEYMRGRMASHWPYKILRCNSAHEFSMDMTKKSEGVEASTPGGPGRMSY